MIFTRDLIFIHIGKTGGMSCADYLLHNLQPPIHSCSHESMAEAEAVKLDGLIPIPDVHRHCTLAEALEFIARFNGQPLSRFSKVVAVIRHPYTLEYSFYRHLQKPRVRALRWDEPNLLTLADGDFRTFVEQADYHREGHPQEAFVRLGNDIPDAVELVSLEELAEAFPRAVSPFLKPEAAYPFPHHNRTEYDEELGAVLTDDVRALLYRKHRFMFDSGLYSTDWA